MNTYFINFDGTKIIHYFNNVKKKRKKFKKMC